MNKKATFIEAITEAKAILVFVLVVVLYFALYWISKQMVANRVQSTFDANDANLVLNNLLYHQITYNGMQISTAELLNIYYASGQKSNWNVEPYAGQVLNEFFTRKLKQVYGDQKWKIKTYLFESNIPAHNFDILPYGDDVGEEVIITQVIPTQDKKIIHIQLLMENE